MPTQTMHIRFRPVMIWKTPLQEISAVSGEQNSWTIQINRAMQQLDRVTQQHSTSSKEMAATAEKLANQAKMLQKTGAFFTVGRHHERA